MAYTNMAHDKWWNGMSEDRKGEIRKHYHDRLPYKSVHPATMREMQWHELPSCTRMVLLEVKTPRVELEETDNA